MRPLPFILANTDHGAMIVSRMDFGVYPDGGVYGVGAQLLTNASYDAVEVALGIGILNERRDSHGDGVVAVDCGANIGVHTVTWAVEMTGWGEVVAFEPQERVYYALAGNIALANAFNARACNVAVGAAVGKTRVPRPDHLRPASYGSVEMRLDPATEYVGQAISYLEADTDAVVMTSIDALGLPRLDLLKIDVERMELDVIAGARDTIMRCRPVMFVEWTKVGLPAVVTALEPHGYDFAARDMVVVARPK